MTTPSFDTLKFANRLKVAGVPDIQAEAETAALADVMAEAVTTSDLATKQDIKKSPRPRPILSAGLSLSAYCQSQSSRL
jgi:hypothetical protein